MSEKDIFLQDKLNLNEILFILKSYFMQIVAFVLLCVLSVSTYLVLKKEVYVASIVVELIQVPVLDNGEVNLVPLENIVQTILATEANYTKKNEIYIFKMSDSLIGVKAESDSLKKLDLKLNRVADYIQSRQSKMLNEMKSFAELNKSFYYLENEEIRRSVHDRKRKNITFRGVYESYKNDLYAICSREYLLVGNKCNKILNNLYYRFLAITQTLEPSPLFFFDMKLALETDRFYREVRKREVLRTIERFNSNTKKTKLLGEKRVERKLTLKKKIMIIALTTITSFSFICFLYLCLVRLGFLSFSKEVNNV